MRNAEALTAFAGFLIALAGKARPVLPPEAFAAFLAGAFFDLGAVIRAALERSDNFAFAFEEGLFLSSRLDIWPPRYWHPPRRVPALDTCGDDGSFQGDPIGATPA